MPEVKETYVTEEGKKKLEEELEQLISVKRGEIAQRLKEAIAMGDLSENSEYDDAKNEQSRVEGRIKELEQQIRTAKVIKTKKRGKKTRVEIGCTVTLVDMADDSEQEFMIVGSTETDPFSGKISDESPVGSAVMGARQGDEVEVETPSGVVKYMVKNIKVV